MVSHELRHMPENKHYIDGHTHLENGDLSKDTVYAFIQVAINKGLKHIQILDHTHRFYEFKDMYEEICKIDVQREWFEKKQKNSIKEYYALIEEIRQEEFPIQVSFGLEVCYMPGYEDFLKPLLTSYPYDFLVGSVHSVDGYLYDMDAFSRQLLWDKHDPKEIYQKYYENLKGAIRSNLFTQIGHPDVIKMYGYDPGYDLHDTYQELADLAIKHHVKMEDNTGAHYRYHHPDIGLNNDFRNILKEKNVEIISASDAHYPEDVARFFELLK